MNTRRLNVGVIGAVRQSIGCDNEDDDSKDASIAAMTPIEVLGHYLTWHGILGYTSCIWEAVENIKEAAGEKSKGTGHHR